jgi:hypothetical protein
MDAQKVFEMVDQMVASMAGLLDVWWVEKLVV